MGNPILQLTGYPTPEHSHPYILSSDQLPAPTQYQTVALTHLHWRGKVYVGSLLSKHRTSPEKVIVKLAIGSDKFCALDHEARLYNEGLQHLQGSVVPRCYGFYTAKIEVDGREVPMGCLLLELCDANGIRMEGPERARYDWLRMEAVRRLHEAGITHGSITKDYHHFVQKGSGARIVDFSLAGRMHKCRWGRPCPELRAMQQNLLGMSYAG